MMIGISAQDAGSQPETTRNGATKMTTLMSRSFIRNNAARLRNIKEQIIRLRETLNDTAERNQTSVDHYTEWEPKYDEFEDRESAIRSAEIAMRLEQAADDINASIHQMEQSLKIATEGEMR